MKKLHFKVYIEDDKGFCEIEIPGGMPKTFISPEFIPTLTFEEKDSDLLTRIIANTIGILSYPKFNLRDMKKMKKESFDSLKLI
jgi:hypothetical protein